tara:strand:+ start:266 stop:766 length:501 start_codon:yes stop_codon:yes gene_type:complete
MSKETKWYNCPVFCGQAPGFMAGIFDTEDEFNERNTQANELVDSGQATGKPIDKNTDHFSIYFHGELEYMIGFDIVSFIDGTFPEIKYGDKIKSITYTPDGEKHNTIVYVGKYTSNSPWSHEKTEYLNEKLYCLVLLASEKPDFKDMEGGTVIFNIGDDNENKRTQ